MPENLMGFLTLALCIGIPVLVGMLSSFATSQSVDTWYAALRKPAYNPPNTVFSPVWTSLYILMGVSLYMIWRSPDSPARYLSLLAFGTQLFLNFAWSYIFFFFRRIAMAFGEIILLWLGILVMILLFHRVNEAAAWLQIPYLLWAGFAVLLNGAILAKNPESHARRPASGVEDASGVAGTFRPD
jgi:tryptophan-rich sensory protein